jgi:hypothetical protein
MPIVMMHIGFLLSGVDVKGVGSIDMHEEVISILFDSVPMVIQGSCGEGR